MISDRCYPVGMTAATPEHSNSSSRARAAPQALVHTLRSEQARHANISSQDAEVWQDFLMP